MRPRVYAPLIALLGTLSLLLLAVPSTQAQSSIHAADRAVLKAFYTATGGPNWQHTTSWDTIDTAPWLYGVFVDTDGRVTRIRLDGNRLSGQLPDLSALTRLTTLTLHNNQLTGTLPNLPPSLTTLTLYNNRLNERLPDLSALTNLTTLTLHNNQLRGTLPRLSPSLTTLTLHTNHLRGPLPDLSSLTSLTELDLSTNQLGLNQQGEQIANPLIGLASKLPASSLRGLWLSNNQLRGPIPDLSALTHLTTLTLFNNHLSEPLPSLPPSLTTLSLYNNQLSGNLDGLSALTNLTTLHLHTNQLSGGLNALSALTDLTTLHLHTNKLTDPLPDLSALTNLTTLHLFNNQLRGSLPSLPPSLTTLTLHTNKLTGKIPAELGSLTDLTTLTLHTNHLRGPLPDLSSLTSLTELDLSTNQLGLNQQGEQIANPLIGLASKLPASSLRGLWLSNNHLHGPIPDLSALSRLNRLYLQDNALTGSVPVPPFHMTDLFLHNNRLSGALDNLGRRGILVRLSLYDNPRGSPSALYGYPTNIEYRYLHLFAPGNGDPVCLPTTKDGTDCTVPPRVDRLRLRAHPTGFTATWEPQPADAAPRGYWAEYFLPGRSAINAPVIGTTATVTGLTPGAQYDFIVQATGLLPWLRATVTLPQRPPPPPPPGPTGDDNGDNNGGDNGGDNDGDNGGGNGGGGGGGTRTPDDRHGDTPATATPLTPAGQTGALSRTIDAHLQSRRDVDYFTLNLPHAGVLIARTTGGDTTGRLYQAQDDDTPVLLAEDTASGPFQVGAAVEPGTYYLAVSAGASFGDYRLGVDYTPAFVENPAPDSPQSGLGVLSGWVCAADTVEIELIPASGETQTMVPATGTARADTAGVCGADTTDTGFGLLFNWNLLSDGAHTVRVLVNAVVFAERQVTVTTLGPHDDQEYRRGLRATSELPDFPDVGQTTTLRWEEALQNFVIAAGEQAHGGEQLTPEQARLENPAPGSFQSGLGVISGWVCAADTVEVVFEPEGTDASLPFEAGAGTARADTADHCGDQRQWLWLVVQLEPAR